MNIWPDAVETFNRSLANGNVYRKFVWVLSGFIEMLIKNILKNLKTRDLGDTLLHYKNENEN